MNRFTFTLTVVGLAVLLLGGCVTTIDGPDRKPSSQVDRLNAQLNLGRGYLRKKDYLGARAPLEKALQTDPTSPEAHVLMAILNEGEEEPELAEKQYLQALKLSPENPMAQSNYGRYLHSLGRLDEALKYLRKAVNESGYSGRALAYQNLGMAELQADNSKLAQDAFLRAVSFDSSLYSSVFELADIAFKAQDYVTSKKYYDLYAARIKQGARSLWLGIQLERRFNNTDSLASYELALRNLFPASQEYLLYKESLD